MDAFIVMLKNVLLFVALAVPGYLLVKTKILKGADTGIVSNILLYLAMPFLVIYSVMDVSFGKRELIQVCGAIVVGFAYTALTFFLSGALLKAKDGDEKKLGVERFCSIFPNNGFLGIPLAGAVFGENSPVILSLVIINIINNTAIFTLGSYLISGDKKTMNFKKVLFNPVLIGLVVGVVLNVCKVGDWLPEAGKYAGHFNNLVTPLAMLVLGMKLADARILRLFTAKKGYYISFLKLVLFPVLSVGILLGIHAWNEKVVDVVLLRAAFVAFATPTATLGSALADKFGGDGETAAKHTLLTTVLSVATLPLLYWVFNALI